MKMRLAYILQEGLRSRLDYLNSGTDPLKQKITEYKKDLKAVEKWHKENNIKFDKVYYEYGEKDYTLP